MYYKEWLITFPRDVRLQNSQNVLKYSTATSSYFLFMVYSLGPPNCNLSHGWIKRSPLLGWVVLFGIDPLRRILADLSAKRGCSLTGRCWDHSNSLFGEWGNFSGQRAKSGPVVQTETVTRSALVSRVTSLQQHRANSGPHLERPADASVFLLGNLPSGRHVPSEIYVCTFVLETTFVLHFCFTTCSISDALLVLKQTLSD